MADANKDANLHNEKRDMNRDPISGAPGAHPVGTGIGAAGAGAAGAAIGAAAGPVGAVVGAAIGAVAGGLAGKGVAEYIDPTAENEYWRNNFRNRPYHNKEYDYDRDYAPAYRYGWESRSRYSGRRYDEVESDLGRDWDRNRGESRLTWDNARMATRDAWDRIDTNTSADRDRIGAAHSTGTATPTGSTLGGSTASTGTMGSTGSTGGTGLGSTGSGSARPMTDTDKSRGSGGSCNI